MKKYLSTTIMLMCLFGCSNVKHVDELMALKQIAGSQAEMEEYVIEQDKNFDRLLNAVKEDEIKEYKNQRKIRKEFGEPIYSKQITRGSQDQKEWLYRYSTQYFDSDKVYLYFDDDGKLIDWALFEKENN